MNAADPPQPLLSRLLQVPFQKLLVLVVLAPLLSLCYYLPQWTPLYKSKPIPSWAIDTAVPFQPWWIFPYMSMYVLILIPPALATCADHLRRYTIGMGLMFIVACAVFFLWPISYPRPLSDPSANAMYRHIVSIDQPINSLPSLHAGMTAYAMFFAGRMLTDLPPARRRLLLTLGWIWAGLILYGTLATKQHYFIDLPPGALLAWITYRLTWRRCETPVKAGKLAR